MCVCVCVCVYIYIYIYVCVCVCVYRTHTQRAKQCVNYSGWKHTTLALGRQDKSIKVRSSKKKSTPPDISAFNSAHVRKISWTPVPLDYMFSLFLFNFFVLFCYFVRDIHCRKRHTKTKGKE